MQVEQTLKKIKFYHPFVLYLLMIGLGIAVGLSEIESLKTFGMIIADIFIRIFKLISLPIIALSIIVTISCLPAEGSIKNLWRRALLYTLSTTFIAALVSCAVYLFVNPKNVSITSMASQDLIVDKQPHYLQYLSNLIPANIFSPFLEHQVMGVLLFSILIGISIRYIPEQEVKQTVIHLFRGLHGMFFVMTKWIIAILPLGIFGFITSMMVQLQGSISLGSISEYLSIVVLANVIQGFIILPLWLKWNKIKPFQAMRSMMPALSVAFFSKSSAGTLPITMSTAETKLGIQPKVSRFILPLCTSLNMNGCAAFIFVTVIYLMQNHGIPITLTTMAAWVVIATIAAVGNAGVPMGCFFLSASLLASMNVPIALLGIILPFYNVIDMVETSLNVWSDSCVAKVVNEHEVNSSKT